MTSMTLQSLFSIVVMCKYLVLYLRGEEAKGETLRLYL